MLNTKHITVSQLLAQTLRVHGVEVVFGLPGGATLPLLAAFKAEGIAFELVRNENSAVFMADVTARLTGTLGVAVVTLGPGLTNAQGAIAHAHLDRAPVMVISADFPTDVLGRHTHQVLDLQAVMRPITKYTARLKPETAAAQLQHAIHMATSGRPGPVQLSVTLKAAESTANTHAPTLALPHAAAHDVAALMTARALLNQAKRPVICVGLGMEPEGCYDALQALAESLQAPVIELPKGKGALANDHPLYAGTIGVMKRDPAVQIVDEADCVIAVGFDVVELVAPWEYQTPLIWIAPWENNDPALPASAEFVGKMAPVLQQLCDSGGLAADDWGARRVAGLNQQLAARSLPQPASGRVLPQTVISALRAVAPRSTLVATDVGSHKIMTALEWQALAPNRYMLSNGLSMMGFALPAAIAAARQLNEPVVCVTGDGGFQMVLGELSLLTQSDLPVVIIVMNDEALDLIRAKQWHRGEDTYGTTFVNPNYEQIARAFGLGYAQISAETDPITILRAAISGRQPIIVEALIDPISYPTTPGRGGSISI